MITLIGIRLKFHCLVLEYVPNMTLEGLLAYKDDSLLLLGESDILILMNICSTLIFPYSCKLHNVVHDDLKPSSVLLDVTFVAGGWGGFGTLEVDFFVFFI